mmetsp:Transcript_13429/g.37071  ORF Transcript_13429/g.37071 Transcript_13429/m.37071 type:complete len:116 (+) Transcript_13429:1495-1842(+)
MKVAVHGLSLVNAPQMEASCCSIVPSLVGNVIQPVWTSMQVVVSGLVLVNAPKILAICSLFVPRVAGNAVHSEKMCCYSGFLARTLKQSKTKGKWDCWELPDFLADLLIVGNTKL